IDPEDYHLALRRAETQAAVAGAAVESAAAEIARCETDLTQAESELAIERGAQAVAAREYELLGAELDPEDRGLVLREPHLRKARAAREAAAAAKRKAEAAHASAVASREAAEIALADARLALQRTAVRMPFNAMVNNRRVNLGAQVAPGNPLALMVGTDEYWVVAAIPVDELRRIHIPDFNSDAGSAVRIHHAAAWGDGAGRTGTVERLWGDVEPEGRMARLLISVPDPLDLEAPADRRRPLILGGYVRVEIDGRTLEDVVRLDREHLRDGGQVWVMGPDDRLEIRDVAIAWSGGDDVCIDDGLADGDRLVVSDLGAAVEGMLLRTAETTTRTAGQEERP
ncbi:MAG: efflux RND transporter periplasmic adaptor subunit, partial [Planctomycetota bacterium]